jgi:hypothetical protein
VTHDQIDIRAFVVIKLLVHRVGFVLSLLRVALIAKHFLHTFRVHLEQIAQKEAVEAGKNVHCVVVNERGMCIASKCTQTRVHFLACEPFIVEYVKYAQIV